MTLSFLWSAIIGAAKKTVRAWRFVVAVMLLSLVIVAGCDVRPFSEFSGDDNGSENSDDTDGDDTDSDDDDVPDDTLTVTPTTLTTSVNMTETIDLEVENPDAGRVYTFTITTPPTNGRPEINESTGVLTYTPNTDSTESDSLVVTVRDDGTPQRSGMTTIQITVTQ